MSLVTFKRRAEATHFEGETFDRLDLRSMKAFGSTFKDCMFTDCKMDLADWRASRFEGCTFTRCEMRLVNFATSFFEESAFADCNLEQASFMGSHFTNVTFGDCRMAYGETLFQDATAKQGLSFYGCNLHGSNLDFRHAEPKALAFSECNLWGAKMSFGCAFFNATLDDRGKRQFLALVARVSQDAAVAEMAGDEYAIVMRAMGGDKG